MNRSSGHRVVPQTVGGRIALGALLAVLVTAVVPGTGCILISGADSEVQCEVDDDCADLGEEFGDTICSPEKVCVSRANPASSSSSTTSSGTGVVEGCTSNAECTAQEGEPAICRQPGEDCVRLLSEDCTQVIGPYEDDNAIFYGIMMGLTGAFEFAGEATIPYLELPLVEINEKHGGLPGIAGGPKRPFVGLLCDAAADSERAAEHVVLDVGAPALMTEYTQFVLDLSNVTIPNGAFLLSATATQNRLDALTNTDLVWSMQPRDRDNNPGDKRLIEYLEAQIREDRGLAPTDKVKLAYLVASDQSTPADELVLELTINGELALDDPEHFRRIDFDSDDSDLNVPAAELLAFQPDIIITSTGPEVVDLGLIATVEEEWPDGDPKPEWKITSTTVGTPNTITLMLELGDEFRRRVRGLDVLYYYDTPEHKAYQLRFENATGSPPAPTTDEYYESQYMLAYLMTATRQEKPTGAAMAQAIPKLDGTSPEIYAGPNDYIEAGQSLLAGGSIALGGAMGDYVFDYINKHLIRDYAILCFYIDEEGQLNIDATGDYGIYDPVTDEFTNLRRCE